MQYTWQDTLLVAINGRGERELVRVRMVVAEQDGRPVSAWAPWWPTWSVQHGAIPVGLS